MLRLGLLISTFPRAQVVGLSTLKQSATGSLLLLNCPRPERGEKRLSQLSRTTQKSLKLRSSTFRKISKRKQSDAGKLSLSFNEELELFKYS